MSISEGYLALCVSILRKVPPEKAFRLLGNGKPYEEPKKESRRWGETEIKLMQLMRDRGLEWSEIGKKFGISGVHANSLVTYRTRRKQYGACREEM